MNFTRAAAVIALVVTLVAVGDLLYVRYQEKVELKFELEALDRAVCRAKKESAVANWEYVESRIALLDQQHKYAEEAAFEKQHASERPVDADLPCPNCDLSGPDYTTPGAVAVSGLIAALALFGAAKRTT